MIRFDTLIFDYDTKDDFVFSRAVVISHDRCFWIVFVRIFWLSKEILKCIGLKVHIPTTRRTRKNAWVIPDQNAFATEASFNTNRNSFLKRVRDFLARFFVGINIY